MKNIILNKTKNLLFVFVQFTLKTSYRKTSGDFIWEKTAKTLHRD